MIKCVLIDVDNVLITEIIEMDAEIGEPNCKLINPYLFKDIDDMKPWSLAKEGKLNDLKIVLKASLEMIRIISILFYPVMPDSSEKILNALNISLDSDKSSFTGENQIAPLAVNKKIGELNLLFPKIDKIEG